MRQLLIGLACAPLLLAGCDFSDTEYSGDAKIPTISVSATGEVSMAPDLASVSAGVVTQGKDAGAAMNANRSKMNAVMEQLKTAGIKPEDIRTSQLTLQPRYNYQNRQAPTISAYEARNTVTVKTSDLSKIGPMLDALVAAGVNNINTVNFSVKDPKAARAKAREMAIIEAREKAENMAHAAGVSLGHLQNLSESGGASPYYPQARMEMAASMDAAPTPVAAGQSTLSVTVNMIYAIDQ